MLANLNIRGRHLITVIMCDSEKGNESKTKNNDISLLSELILETDLAENYADCVDYEELSVPGRDKYIEQHLDVNAEDGQSTNATEVTLSDDCTKREEGDEHEEETEPTLEREQDFDHPFSKQTWREDLTLIVEEKCLYVNKYVLDACSPVFSKMLECGQVKTLKIQDTTFHAMVEFLCCIYPHILKPVTVSNIYSVMELAGKYQVQSLISAIKHLIEDKAVATTKCADLLRFLLVCQHFGLGQLKKQCLQALDNKDLARLEEIEVNNDDNQATMISNIYKLKAERYFNMANELASTCKQLKMKRNDFKKMYLFLLDDNTWSDKENATSVFGGELNTVRVTWIPQWTGSCYGLSVKEIYDKPSNIETITVSSETNIIRKTPYVVLKIKFKETCHSTVNGRVYLTNFVERDASKVGRFFKKVSKGDQNVKAICEISPSDLREPKNGFLQFGIGEIVIQYIAKD